MVSAQIKTIIYGHLMWRVHGTVAAWRTLLAEDTPSACKALPLWTKVKLQNERDFAIPSFPTGLLYVDCEQAPAQKVFVNPSGWDTPLSQLIRLSHCYVVIRKSLGVFIFKRRRLSSVSDWFMWNPMEASLPSNKKISIVINILRF